MRFAHPNSRAWPFGSELLEHFISPTSYLLIFLMGGGLPKLPIPPCYGAKAAGGNILGSVKVTEVISS